MAESLPNEPVTNDPAQHEHAGTSASQATCPDPMPGAGSLTNQRRREARRWWIKLFVQPALLLLAGTTLFVGLGIAQRFGFLSYSKHAQSQVTPDDAEARFICPMMCTPPLSAPGRCPVCGMELVRLATNSALSDWHSVYIDPAARRITNIQTVPVASMPVTRQLRVVGDLTYDEGGLKTISAYVDGRLERLYADYTGVVVQKGDPLALLYSPRLYSSQVEFLLAKKARDESRGSTFARLTESNRELHASARQRLIELGMTEPQIEELEQSGQANSRMQVAAPISGTVIEKLAVEGQYVKVGDPIYRLADLSTVWLMLRLFPEDAAMIREGQEVAAEVQSLAGRRFVGRVAFIDPSVDPRTRTVGVRVAIPNEEGLLRVGDYAKATLDVALAEGQPALVVPRDAVLMTGDSSVLYIETSPGRFEIRRVVLGPSMGDHIVVRAGVELGEQVATRGNFLIDSQMQLAGNPSLIDPSRLQPGAERGLYPEIIAALSRLSADDRALAEKQHICPITEQPLGRMGTPTKVEVEGAPVFICCEACRTRLVSEPDKYLAKLLTVTREKAATDGPAAASAVEHPRESPR